MGIHSTVMVTDWGEVTCGLFSPSVLWVVSVINAATLSLKTWGGGVFLNDPMTTVKQKQQAETRNDRII